MSGDTASFPIPTAGGSTTATRTSAAGEPTSAPVGDAVGDTPSPAAEGNDNDKPLTRLQAVGIASGGIVVVAFVVGTVALYRMRKRREKRIKRCACVVPGCECKKRGGVDQFSASSSGDAEDGDADRRLNFDIGVKGRRGHAKENSVDTAVSSGSVKPTEAESPVRWRSGARPLGNNLSRQSMDGPLLCHARPQELSPAFGDGSQQLAAVVPRCSKTAGNPFSRGDVDLGNTVEDQSRHPAEPAQRTEVNFQPEEKTPPPEYASPVKAPRVGKIKLKKWRSPPRYVTPIRRSRRRGRAQRTETPPPKYASPAKTLQHAEAKATRKKKQPEETDGQCTTDIASFSADTPAINSMFSGVIMKSTETEEEPPMYATPMRLVRGVVDTSKEQDGILQEVAADDPPPRHMTPAKASRGNLAKAENLTRSPPKHASPTGHSWLGGPPKQANGQEVTDDEFMLRSVEKQLSAELNESLLSCDTMKPRNIEGSSPVVPTAEKLLLQMSRADHPQMTTVEVKPREARPSLTFSELKQTTREEPQTKAWNPPVWHQQL